MFSAKHLTLMSVLIVSVVFTHINSPRIEEAVTDNAFFSSAKIELSSSYKTLSDGDLWASCWSDDDNLYAANGDGKGFNLLAFNYSDIAMNRVSGSFNSLWGRTISAGDSLGQVWTSGRRYNRKPTGMLCVDGTMYVAIQDLNLNYDDAPAASISKSVDHGVTWTWDHSGPMFNNYKFTTLMFLDYGKNYENAIDQYVYVYGLDNNWRDSFTHTVPDPVDLYLARVPRTSVQDRSAWEFFAGLDDQGNPRWSTNIKDKSTVLHDERRVYSKLTSTEVSNLTVLGQGGIVFNKPLNRYIYTSWTEYTFEFYEAPTPWGPWNHFLTQDFGPYPWSYTQHGGYATTIPSKFISPDGKEMWVQSNVCPCGGAGMADYNFSLRKLTVELHGANKTVATSPLD
jgi:hypothetical protein